MSYSIDYKKSGVDIKAGNELVEQIKPFIKKTYNSSVIAGVGGFASLYQIPSGYKKPLLVSATDGVGTKLKLAIEHNNSKGVGIDLVAMCVNDLLCTGAKPLYFLDYYATAQLDIARAKEVIESIARGCLQSEISLIGGESAEMPGMYRQGDYDLAGFCVGIVDKKKIIDGHKLKQGDSIIALASSGFHSNGYSLIRNILTQHPQWLETNNNLINELLEPTRIYTSVIMPLLQKFKIKAISHITGGGLIENIPRVLKKGLLADIDIHSWQIPSLMRQAQKYAHLSDYELYRTFNCGIGLVLIVSSKKAERLIEYLKEQGEKSWRLGEIKPSVKNKIRLGSIEC